MNKKSIYVAFCNQKGGVGKSEFTTLAASYLHFTGGKTVAVIDCDYPQHSIFAMRERDKSVVMANDQLKQMMVIQNKKAYSVITSKPEDALDTARKYLAETQLNIDVVFFDLSGTVSSSGILTSMLNMDYIFCPVTTDRLVMQSSLTFASIIKDCLAKHPDVPLQSLYLFWNQLVKSENREIYDAYCAIIQQLKLDVLKTEIPFTVKYKRELSVNNEQVFRSTVFPPTKTLVKGSCLDSLMDEICQIINLK